MPDAVPKEDVGDARLGTTLVGTKGAERGVMLPDLGRRDPFIPKGFGHSSRDVGIPGLMDMPSAWGAAAGYTAEALKTHHSGVPQVAAELGGTKQGLFKFCVSLQGIFIIN